MRTIVREWVRSALHRRASRGKDIDKGHAPGRGDFGHGGGIECEIPVNRILCSLNRDRRQKDDSRSRFSIESRGPELLQVFRETFFELIELRFAAKALIKSERRKNHVDLLSREMLCHRREVVRPGLQVHFIPRPREIADDEIEIGMSLIEHRLEDAVASRLFEKPVADKGNAITLFEPQRQSCRDSFPLQRIRC